MKTLVWRHCTSEGASMPRSGAEAGMLGLDRLSDRELEVLKLVSEHYTNREIADRLVLAECTVETHLHHILTKLRVRSRHAAARLYLDAAGKTHSASRSVETIPRSS